MVGYSVITKNVFESYVKIRDKTHEVKFKVYLYGTTLVAQQLRLCSQCRGPGFSPWSGN